MEKKIKKLFDANEIIKNEKLCDMIADTMNRYYGKKRVELSEEEAEHLSAAGDALYNPKKTDFLI